MAAGRAEADDRGMTTEQPTAPRLLRRRGDDRVLGGVASGLADYFNVDPLLVRIGFVGLMVFNGLGLGLYLLAWLFVPTDTDNQSVVQRVFGRIGVGGLLVLGLIAIVLIVLFNVPARVAPFDEPGAPGGVEFAVIALIVIAIGALLFRRSEPNAVVAAESITVDAAPAATPPRVAVRRPPRPPSPLGWYALGAMLIGIGLLAMATVVAGTAVDLGRYFGLALAIIGVALLVGTWWGHARLLIALGLLLLPFAYAASLIGDVPMEGGFGTENASPVSAEDLSDEYRLVGGQVFLDLTQIEDTGEPIEVAASVAMGTVIVWLPEDAGLDVTASVGGGDMRILGVYEDGTNLEAHRVVEGDGPQFVLDLDAGLGVVHVDSRIMENR
jgi:phage shock protein PspC (stress-responsive transcriptional regulator)